MLNFKSLPSFILIMLCFSFRGRQKACLERKSYCKGHIKTTNFISSYKPYMINALSAVQLDTHIVNTMNTHIHSEIQHTYTHSYMYKQPFLRRYSFCLHAFTHSYLCGNCERTISPLSFQQFVFCGSWIDDRP